jgi:hypothetical protein
VFEIRPDIGFIQTSRENIVAIIESINQPMVAAAGGSAEQTKCYIVGVRNDSGLFSVHIYLYMNNTQECLVYLHDPPEIQMDDYHDTELEALGFVESMGFMVDNLNFRTMQPEVQLETMASLPVFHADLKAWAATQAGAQTVDEEVDEDGVIDLTPLEDDVIELDEVAEELVDPSPPAKVITPEGLAKIIRMFSSF